MRDYPRIIFFGTPEFAAASLNALINEGFHVAGVVTAPDRPSGRGMHLSSPVVKKVALEKELLVMQPGNLKDPSFHDELKRLRADLQVVVAFRLLPAEVWSMPPLGTFNLHASLLPHYRGAAPVNWAIINGETESGVTTFFIDDKIDTGTVLFQKSTPIGPDETAGELHDRLMVLGAGLVTETAAAIADHAVKGTQQDLLLPPGIQIRKAPRIFHEDCRINWDDNAIRIFNFIRGLCPHPGAYTTLTSSDGTSHYLKIYKAKPELKEHSLMPGNVSTDEKTFLKIAVRDGFIHLEELQPAGRKSLLIADFLRGLRVPFS